MMNTILWQVLLDEAINSLLGCCINSTLSVAIQLCYSLVWLFAWVRHEIQTSPLSHVFL